MNPTTGVETLTSLPGAGTSALCDLSAHALRGLIGRRQISPVELTKSHLDRIRRLDSRLNAFLLVTEEQIEHAVSLLINIEKTVVEGAGAAGLAALVANPAMFRGQKVGLVLCGGNIDTRLLASVLTRELAREGRLSQLAIDLVDRPGQLAKVANILGEAGANIVEVQHQRVFSDLPAKGALLEAWKTMGRRRTDFGAGFCSPIVSAWLEEAMEVDDLPLPAGAPEFLECRAAYGNVKWMGPGRGWIDPVAEKQGAVLGMDAGLSTLEDEVAEAAGADWEEVLDQRALEVEAFKKRGLPVPTWAGMQTPGVEPGRPANATPPPPQPK